MATYSTNTQIVAGKAEVTPGTVLATEPADFTTKFTSAELTVDIGSERKKFANGNHSHGISVPGSAAASFKGSCDLASSGSYAVEPDFYKFAKACGHTVVDYKRAISGATASGQKVVNIAGTVTGNFTIGQVVTLKEGVLTENCTVATVGTTSLTMVANLTSSYTAAGFLYAGQALQPLKAADTSTVSIEAFELQTGVASPVSRKLACGGFAGAMDIKADGIGKSLTVEFDMQGKYASLAEASFANTPVFSGNCTSVGDTLLGTTLTVGGVATTLSKFNLSSGNAVTRIEDGSDASGYLYGIIEKREPVVTCDPLKASATTDNEYAKAIAATTAEIILTTAHFQIRVPNAQTIAPKSANRNGVQSWEKTYECQGNCTSAGAAIDTVLPTEATYEIIHGKRC